MRETPKVTPKHGPKSASKIQTADKTNSGGKKLVQTRLPFKTIAVAGDAQVKEQATPELDKSQAEVTSDIRKRKLSFVTADHNKHDLTDNPPETLPLRRSNSKENINEAGAAKRKKSTDEAREDGLPQIIVLVDSDEEKCAGKVISHVDVGAVTPTCVAISTAGGSATNGSGTRVFTFQIKLPKSNKKKIVRKSQKNQQEAEIVAKVDAADKSEPEPAGHGYSTDEIEEIANELNPQKRQRLSQAADSEPETAKATELATNIQSPSKSEQVADAAALQQQAQSADQTVPQTIKNSPTKQHESEQVANDEAEKTTEQKNETSTEASDSLNQTADSHNQTADSLNQTAEIIEKPRKNLTPEQQKLFEQRRKAREEKELKLQEERRQKQLEKQQREEAKQREREEKRKEHEEKERKRLERTVAKEEELRKKDEERKRKEQEKEDAELKKQRAIAAFTKFFVPKTADSRLVSTHSELPQQAASQHDLTADNLAFRPFSIKDGMKLAPITRKSLTNAARRQLESFLPQQHTKAVADDEEHNASTKLPARAQLYLAELTGGTIRPDKWRQRISTDSKDAEPQVIEDDLERVGQAIIEEHARNERFRAKFLKFHENRRPAYYGTWRKQSSVITARRPFAQDTKYFDYEIDSDYEWEDEEPGESLDGSDDDKDKETDDDEEDYEVDNEWFVPHGHLSDEELQNEEDFDNADNTREAQKAKLQLMQQEFAQEMKKQTKKIKPRLIGCIWLDVNGNQPKDCPSIIWDTLNKRAMICITPIEIVEPPQTDATEQSTIGGDERQNDKAKSFEFTDELLKQLICLVHGNMHSRNFLIAEFIAHLETHVEEIKMDQVALPTKAIVRDQIHELAVWKPVALTEIGRNSSQSSEKKSNKTKKRLCWIVAEHMRAKFQLQTLTLQNSWTYTLTPKYTQPVDETKTNDAASDSSDEAADDNMEDKAKVGKRKSKLTVAAAAGQTEKKLHTPIKNTLISKFLLKTDKSDAKQSSTMT